MARLTLAFVICLIVLSNTVVYGYMGATKFSSDLYFECVKTTNSNVIISPFSVANAIALLSQAANENTNTYIELTRGFHIEDDKRVNKTVIANDFRLYYDLLQSDAGNVTLSIANRIYIQQGYKVNKTLRDVATHDFHSGIESVNFTNKEEAAGTINHFVEEETNGLIKELVKPDLFNYDSRVVLINAIYFKGNWLYKFDEKLTEKRTFYNYGWQEVQTDFMYFPNINLYSGYVRDLDALALEMKYVRSSFVMLMILPINRNGLHLLETEMRGYDFDKLYEEMNHLNVRVRIPKFKIQYETQLNDVLKNLGMNEMFTQDSKLSGLLEEGEPLRVSDTIHKAFIEVNEGGSESGAASGFLIDRIVGAEDPQFIADYPFIFFILHERTRTPVFSGRITNFE
ncbi:antichymotrypsin-2-like [Sitodiplosis mosellana]|uniref:antichymotrypsin-2-like n=1 Tax=Sitodiplosis mosellana TaxID=263140 RepID=UPI002444A256|nr:antichymotrypsin-2-like [Sitodiplosis mosellana]